MSKFKKIEEAIKQGKTILGVGPMSWNCIEAAIEVANETEIPIVLIASRRQVEDEALGGGYVTTTQMLADLVEILDLKENVFLARDHGGPAQGTNEQNLSHEEAMKTAQRSYRCDIECGFDILHIDPALRVRPFDQIIKDVKKLHQFCEEVSYKEGKKVIYEVGIEAHSGNLTDIENFKLFAREMTDLRNVRFIVGNTGLFVQELENTGRFNRNQTKEMIRVCNDNGLYFKAHNTDYFSNEGYELMNEVGVHSINIAPEYGTLESQVMLGHLSFSEQLRFIELSVKSKKWTKWLKRYREGDTISPGGREYLTAICGHYNFANFRYDMTVTGPNVENWDKIDQIVKNMLKSKIRHQLSLLGWDVG